MLKLGIKLLSAAVLTVLLSVVLLGRNISQGLGDMSVQNGDWSTSLATGSKDAGAMLKATVALGGL